MKRILLPLLSLASCSTLFSCANDNDGPSAAPLTVQPEVEPNDDALTAFAMTLNRPVSGTVTTIADTDFWSIDLAAGETLQIEMFGTRFDHATWDTNINTPQVTIYDTDGLTNLLVQDTLNGSGGWGEIDSDIPQFVAPADGTYYISVEPADIAVAGGEYAMVAKLVTLTAPVQQEIEAAEVTGINDTFLTAEVVTAGTILGFHVNDGFDWYKLTVSEASALSYTLWAFRNGVWQDDDSYYDPEITIFDTDGTTDLSNVDDFYFYDSSAKYVIMTPGDYYVRVGQCCADGDSPYQLELSVTPWTTRVEAEPNDDTATGDPVAFDEFIAGQIDNLDQDVYTFTGTAGDTIRLEYFDEGSLQGSIDDVDIDIRDSTDAMIEFATNSGSTTLQAILTATGTYNFVVTTDADVVIDYAFSMHRVKQATWEIEPNDDSTTAIALDTNGRGAGIMDTITDVDTYSFTAEFDHLVTISCYADSGLMNAGGFYNHTGNGSNLRPILTIKDGTDTTLAFSTADWDECSAEGIVDGKVTMAVSFVAPAEGTYYVEVNDVNGTFDASTFYVIEKR